MWVLDVDVLHVCVYIISTFIMMLNLRNDVGSENNVQGVENAQAHAHFKKKFWKFLSKFI